MAQTRNEGDTGAAQVVMYATLLCPYCVGARRFFESRGIAFEEIRVDQAPERRQEMQQRGGGHTVPQIWIGDVHVGGFEDMLALDRQGRLDRLFA